MINCKRCGRRAKRAHRCILDLPGLGVSLDMDAGGAIVRRPTIDTTAPGDYGADPLGDGTFRMIPSGDVVDYAERCRRLKR